MSTSSQPPFSYLQTKIREWKAGDLLMPGTQNYERFQQVATAQLSHIVSELQQTLAAEGIRASLHGTSEDNRRLSLTIEQFDIEIAFSPAPHPHAFLISARRRANPEDECEGLIAYRDLELDLGHVMQIVEDIALRILGPRRASKEPGKE